MRRAFTLALLVLAMRPMFAWAQLADPGKNDHFVSLFVLHTGADGFAGSISSKGEFEVPIGSKEKRDRNPFGFTWQLDYGSLGTKRVTSTSTAPDKEAVVSKNSGEYVFSYAHLWPAQVRFAIDGGVEHKRRKDGQTQATENAWGPIITVAARQLGSRLVFCRDANDPDTCQQVAWLVHGGAAAAQMIANSGAETTELFLEPLAVGWFSFLAGHQPQRNGPARLFYRFQVRAEVATMSAATAAWASGSHWDGSVIFFLTPANGLGLRRFSGYFDHNLRDKKEAWTFMLVWKFK